jgi:hypothetical protein
MFLSPKSGRHWLPQNQKGWSGLGEKRFPKRREIEQTKKTNPHSG